MSSKTGVISYNLAERARSFRGQDRNFDIAAAVRLINSGSVQERVKHGDMVGYFGHWPRTQFGLDPAEGGFLEGKQVSLEPAIRTTYLKALPDGTVEHEVEFLDTASGKIAERIYGSKAYGFSSAIDAKRLGDKLMPTGFFGFDFVREPNYSTNRGYAIALDGVYDSEDVLDAAAERTALFDEVNALLDSATLAQSTTLATLGRVMEENEELLSMLTRQTAKPEVVLDGLVNVIHGSKKGPLFEAEEFLDAVLPEYEKTDEEVKAPSPTPAADKFLERAGY